jgi:hypothetical protein
LIERKLEIPSRRNNDSRGLSFIVSGDEKKDEKKYFIEASAMVPYYRAQFKLQHLIPHFGDRTISSNPEETPDFADPHRYGGAFID